MKRRTTLTNHDGEHWTVEYCESNSLTQVGGFLVTYGASSCITMNANLARAEKRRNRRHFIRQLMMLPLGTSAVHLWSNDEQEHSELFNQAQEQ